MDAGPLAVKQDFRFKRRKICSGEGMQQAALDRLYHWS